MEIKETVETVETTAGAHQGIMRMRVKWRLRATKETGENTETSGGYYQGIRRARG